MRIIKIGAVWCPGCLVMKKVWNKITNDYPDLEIVNLDYDMNSNEVQKYEAGKVLPIIIFLDKDGHELERLIGEQSEDTLRRMIDKYENN